eukprot:Rmarinus@m.9904
MFGLPSLPARFSVETRKQPNFGIVRVKKSQLEKAAVIAEEQKQSGTKAAVFDGRYLGQFDEVFRESSPEAPPAPPPPNRLRQRRPSDVIFSESMSYPRDPNTLIGAPAPKYSAHTVPIVPVPLPGNPRTPVRRDEQGYILSESYVQRQNAASESSLPPRSPAKPLSDVVSLPPLPQLKSKEGDSPVPPLKLPRHGSPGRGVSSVSPDEEESERDCYFSEVQSARYARELRLSMIRGGGKPLTARDMEEGGPMYVATARDRQKMRLRRAARFEETTQTRTQWRMMKDYRHKGIKDRPGHHVNNVDVRSLGWLSDTSERRRLQKHPGSRHVIHVTSSMDKTTGPSHASGHQPSAVDVTYGNHPGGRNQLEDRLNPRERAWEIGESPTPSSLQPGVSSSSHIKLAPPLVGEVVTHSNARVSPITRTVESPRTSARALKPSRGDDQMHSHSRESTRTAVAEGPNEGEISDMETQAPRDEMPLDAAASRVHHSVTHSPKPEVHTSLADYALGDYSDDNIDKLVDVLASSNGPSHTFHDRQDLHKPSRSIKPRQTSLFSELAASNKFKGPKKFNIWQTLTSSSLMGQTSSAQLNQMISVTTRTDVEKKQSDLHQSSTEDVVQEMALFQRMSRTRNKLLDEVQCIRLACRHGWDMAYEGSVLWPSSTMVFPGGGFALHVTVDELEDSMLGAYVAPSGRKTPDAADLFALNPTSPTQEPLPQGAEGDEGDADCQVGSVPFVAGNLGSGGAKPGDGPEDATLGTG